MYDFLIQSTACLLVFYSFYYFFLRRGKAFRLIRFYLLGSITFSLVIPFIEIPIWEPAIAYPDTENLNGLVSVHDSFSFQKKDGSADGERFMPNWSVILSVVYVAGLLVMLFRFLRNFYLIMKLKQEGEMIRESDYHLVLVNRTIQTFSFFKLIFLQKSYYQTGKDAVLILHEQKHIQERHSLDIVFIELFMVLLWFQPLVYLYRRALELNHEYTADEHVLQQGESPRQYFHKVLELSSHSHQLSLVSNFSWYSLKSRIKMMNKHNQSKKVLAIYSGIAIVLAVGLFTAFAFTARQSTPLPGGKFVVIIDAGHGGKDHGASTDSGILEKDVVLDIAKKIREKLAANDRIEVRLTREDDIYINLKERISGSSQADLFLSIHAESHVDKTEDFGMMVYYPGTVYTDKSERLAKLAAYEFQKCGKESKVGTADYLVLTTSKSPSVLINVGYLSNEDDRKFMASESGQSKIAEMIATAIEMAAL